MKNKNFKTIIYFTVFVILLSSCGNFKKKDKMSEKFPVVLDTFKINLFESFKNDQLSTRVTTSN